MTADLHTLHPVSPIGHHLRLGHTGHRQLEDLHASGRFKFDRVVVDAAHINDQKRLLDSLRKSGAEIVLDCRIAELSTPGGYLTSASRLPWALKDRPYAVEDLNQIKIADMSAQICDFAIEHQVDVILAPTRLLLNGPQDPWVPIDVELCGKLRSALDKRGGSAIAIDYPLLTTYQIFLDDIARQSMALRIAGLPFDNLWLRIANFGSDKSAAGIRKYINACRDFHTIGKPIISDGVGGIPAMSIVAFGGVGGICHGVAEKERFYPNSWWKARTSDSGGGAKKRSYFADIDAYLDQEQANSLLAVRGAKPLLGCRDTGCCPGGWEGMISNPKSHYLTQTAKRMQELGRVPDLRRPDHFWSHPLAHVDRMARSVLRLKIGDSKLNEKLTKFSRKADDLRHVLEKLHTTDHNLSRATAPAKRSGRWGTGSKAQGR